MPGTPERRVPDGVLGGMLPPRLSAKTSEAFKTILPQKGTSAEAALGHASGAVISYRADHGRLQAVAVSREERHQGPRQQRGGLRLAAAYRAAMVASGPDPKDKTDHSAGHMLRTKIIDPFTAGSPASVST